MMVTVMVSSQLIAVMVWIVMAMMVTMVMVVMMRVVLILTYINGAEIVYIVETYNIVEKNYIEN